MGGGASKTVPTRADSRISISGKYNDPLIAELIKNASGNPSSKGPTEGGHASNVQEGASAVDAIIAEQRLQKLAFQGDKPGWKEVQRDYNIQSDHGVNRSPKVEWSGKAKNEAGPVAPPKDSRAPPKISSSPLAAKPKPPSSNSAKPNISPMARPQMSPAPSQILNKTESGLIIAPSALQAPSAPIDFTPAGYSSASTIELGATQRKSVVSGGGGGARADVSVDVSTKPGQGSPTKAPNRLLYTSQIFSTPNSAAGPLKPHPPSGGPPPSSQQQRRDSDADADDDKCAEFTDEAIIAENRGL